ncbi:hypothetical protein [Streptomyces hygroscopicus]|uniref:hypothetical protein n=1 Tax=Streptomyces hygroscopicus TaxID=1912 RepID=UPI00131D1DF5|nr:hypothetical protein [Streptomyces hygroscopicus]
MREQGVVLFSLDHSGCFLHEQAQPRRRAGFQSRRWYDSEYSQVLFTGCWAGTGSPGGDKSSTHVDLRWDRTATPDKSWGVKTYANCFKGSSYTTNGEWHGLSGGNHFFQIAKIGGESSNPYLRLSVKRVEVDTTKAD